MTSPTRIGAFAAVQYLAHIDTVLATGEGVRRFGGTLA